MERIISKIKSFKPNVGTPDRVFRVVLGLLFVLVFIYVDLPFITSILLLMAGIISVLSGIFGFCFFYYYFREDFSAKGKSDCSK